MLQKLMSVLTDPELTAHQKLPRARDTLGLAGERELTWAVNAIIQANSLTSDEKRFLLHGLLPEKVPQYEAVWNAQLHYADAEPIAEREVALDDVVFSSNEAVNRYFRELKEVYERESCPFVLSTPATANDLDIVRQLSPFPLPETLIELWKVANGSPSDSSSPFFAAELADFPTGTRVFGCSLVSTRDLVMGYFSTYGERFLREHDEDWGDPAHARGWDSRIVRTWSNVKRVPVFYSQDLLVMIDYDPAPGGTNGQIVAHRRESFPTIKYLADDINEALVLSIEVLRHASEELFY